jgi:hypothetical protein
MSKNSVSEWQPLGKGRLPREVTEDKTEAEHGQAEDDKAGTCYPRAVGPGYKNFKISIEIINPKSWLKQTKKLSCVHPFSSVAHCAAHVCTLFSSAVNP